MILSDTLTYLKAGGGEIDPMTQKAYEYYQAQADALKYSHPEMRRL